MRRPIRTASTYVLDHDPKCKCGNHATSFLQLHRVNDCAEESTLGEFTCSHCLGKTVERLSAICQRAAAVDMRCVTCGMAIVTAADVIVLVSPLDNK